MSKLCVIKTVVSLIKPPCFNYVYLISAFLLYGQKEDNHMEKSFIVKIWHTCENHVIKVYNLFYAKSVDKEFPTSLMLVAIYSSCDGWHTIVW